MKIGILGAMPEEVELIERELQTEAQETVGERTYRWGTLYGQEVVLAHSRMGKVAAASTATRLVESYAVDMILFTGVAGAVSQNLNVGDIVIGDALIQHDLDASPLFERFEIPLLGVSRLPVDPDLVEGASEAAQKYIDEDLSKEVPADVRQALGFETPRVFRGLIASGDQFIDDAELLSELRRMIPGIQCVEMEGAAVGQVCYEHSIPCVIVRTISDRADSAASVDFTRFVKDAARYFSRGVVRHLLEML